MIDFLYAPKTTGDTPMFDIGLNLCIVWLNILRGVSMNILKVSALAVGLMSLSTGSIAATSVNTFSGSLIGTPGAADGAGNTATFNAPEGVSTKPDGTLIVGDVLNSKIRGVDLLGNATTVAGAGVAGLLNGAVATAKISGSVQAVAAPSGIIYIADTGNNVIRAISIAGTVYTLSGTGVAGYVDGAGASAQFNAPSGMVLDGNGDLIVVDQGNHVIRKVAAASGIVTTIAGLGGTPGAVDGINSLARFNLPFGITLDKLGNLIVGDRGNHTIRKITPAGTVSTIAGSGVAGYIEGLGVAAQFNLPSGLAYDQHGNLYVADKGNHVVRRIDPAGNVSTIAGTGVAGLVNSTGILSQFSSPSGIAVSQTNDDIFVVDTGNNSLRKIADTSPPTGTILINGGATHTKTSSVTIGLTCLDNFGCKEMSFSDDGITYTQPVAISPTFIKSLTIGDGLKTVFVKFSDGASNITILSASITLDTVVPLPPLVITPISGLKSNLPIIPTISGTTEPSISVSVYDGVAPIGLVTADITGAWSLVGAGFAADGTHAYNATTTDLAGNLSSVSNSVNYTIDTVLPVITLNGASIVTLEAGVTFVDAGATVSDNIDPVVLNVVSPGVVNSAVIGTTVLNYDAVDSFGNAALTVTRTVNVVDTTPPVIVTGGALIDLYVEATSALTTVATPLFAATDLFPVTVTQVGALAGGYPLGTTVVTTTATDANGNVSTFTQNIHVGDTVPPVFTSSFPDRTEVATLANGGAKVFFPVVTATDAFPGVVVTNNAPIDGVFRGTSVVTWVAKDVNGNVTIVNQNVTVTEQAPLDSGGCVTPSSPLTMLYVMFFSAVVLLMRRRA